MRGPSRRIQEEDGPSMIYICTDRRGNASIHRASVGMKPQDVMKRLGVLGGDWRVTCRREDQHSTVRVVQEMPPR